MVVGMVRSVDALWEGRGPQRHVTTSLGCPGWSGTDPQRIQWRKGLDEEGVKPVATPIAVCESFWES